MLEEIQLKLNVRKKTIHFVGVLASIFLVVLALKYNPQICIFGLFAICIYG